ncbi:hypothetical protein Tco_0105623 [Tanacetum coccineum]
MKIAAVVHIRKVSLYSGMFKPLSEKERPATPEPVWSIPSSSIPVPNHNWASAIASSFVSPPENSLLSQTGDIGVFIDWLCKMQGITKLTPEHLEMEECHKLLTNQVDEGLLRYNVSRPLPGDRLALSITKMKAASYPDAGLEQMVPDQMWAKEEYMYDISASYGISHWWFKRQQFYIERHSADTNRRAIIVLRRADNQEYTIAESDFKDLYPSDFEDLYLLNLQGKYGDSDGYTFDDPLLILEILSRRFHLRGIYLITAKMEMEIPRSSGVNSPPNAHT